jgi:hypothetical protein
MLLVFVVARSLVCVGYVAAGSEPKPKERPSVFKAIRVVLFYGILIMIILNVVSAFGGGGRHSVVAH